jgi:hypothetical protein
MKNITVEKIKSIEQELAQAKVQFVKEHDPENFITHIHKEEFPGENIDDIVVLYDVYARKDGEFYHEQIETPGYEFDFFKLIDFIDKKMQ